MEPLKMTHEHWLDSLNSDLQSGPAARYEIEPCGIRAAIHDGDGGGLVIAVAESGEILSLKLHECSFFGQSYVTVDDLVDWLEHILQLLESEKFSHEDIGTQYAQRKLDLCRRFIELCGENYTETQDGIYLRMARESEQDCIYWQSMQAGNSHEEASKMAYGKIK